MTVLSGATPALVTPLTPDRDVHEDDVTALVRRAVADGAAGVLVAGSTGEGALLGPDQRAQLTRCARTAVDASAGDGTPVTLLAGACAQTVADLHADVARLADAGADLVLVLAPTTYPLTAGELTDLHLEVAERAEAPTLVYHLPQYTGSSLTPDEIAALADHPRIVGMKDSSPDADRRAAFIAAAARAAGDLVVLTGHAPTLQAALEAGAAGSITAIANVRLPAVVALHEAVTAGDAAAAADAQAGLARSSEALARVGSSLPATLKAALQLDGSIAERWCRPPLRSVPGNHLDRVRTAMLP